MSQVTVTEHLLFHQKKTPAASGVFTQLLYDLIVAAKLISRSLNNAGLLDVLGETGEINIQGERVQKLDDLANQAIIHRTERSGAVCIMASEENAEAIQLSEEFKNGDYVLVFDPLDGSSNVDVNINVGTIFSIHKRITPRTGPANITDILQQGALQVAAGYFMYGPSTMLVYSTGHGVHGFTLDPSVGEFLLSHPNIKIPTQGKYYSVNEGNTCYWDEKTKKMVEHFKSSNNERSTPYSSRYVGSLVADFHRTLLYGGIFMYPSLHKELDEVQNKLRLLYEVAPLSFLTENAGGSATNGLVRALDVIPQSLHERSAFLAGSALDVEKAMQFLV